MELSDVFDDLDERKIIAIKGHGVVWSAFQEWQKKMQRVVADPHHSLRTARNFRVVSKSGEVALYADMKVDPSKPFGEGNIRRNYLGSGGRTMAEGRAYCEKLNSGDECTMLRAYGEWLHTEILKGKWDGLREHEAVQAVYNERWGEESFVNT